MAYMATAGKGNLMLSDARLATVVEMRKRAR